MVSPASCVISAATTLSGDPSHSKYDIDDCEEEHKKIKLHGCKNLIIEMSSKYLPQDKK